MQIPSEDMGLDEISSGTLSGPGSVSSSELGLVCEDGYTGRQRTTSSDSVYDTESTTSSRESLTEPSQSVTQVGHCHNHILIYKKLDFYFFISIFLAPLLH